MSSINSSFSSSHDEVLAYQAELSTDLDSGIIDCADVRAYLTKAKIKDPDQPSFTEAMNGEDSERWIEAMKIEIAGLLARNTWNRINREDIPRDKNGKKYNILKSICAFKLKRLPDGSPDRYKARFCARGDMQKEGIDYFDTYAPVVKWSTIRMLLIETLSRNWVTRQVDFTNAFAQGTLSEIVYIESPKGFEGKDRMNMF